MGICVPKTKDLSASLTITSKGVFQTMFFYINFDNTKKSNYL